MKGAPLLADIGVKYIAAFLADCLYCGNACYALGSPVKRCYAPILVDGKNPVCHGTQNRLQKSLIQFGLSSFQASMSPNSLTFHY